MNNSLYYRPHPLWEKKKTITIELVGMEQSCNRCKNFVAKFVDTPANAGLECTQYLENCTGQAQEPLQGEGEKAMAKHRMRMCIGYNDDGSPIVRQISANGEIQLADRIVAEMLKSERATEFLEGDKKDVPTFKAYTEEWLATYKANKCKPTTIAGYRSLLKVYLYPTFGDTPVDEIEVKDIQNLLNRCKESAAKYLREMKTLLSQILECAMRDGYLPNNPAKDGRITIPSTKKTERRALTLDQLQEILADTDKLPERERLYATIALSTALRRGEILGLRWEDIDIDRRIIHVVRNVTYAKNQPYVGTPKTASGTRTIPILDVLLPLLLPKKAGGYLFDNDGCPITQTMYNTIFKHIRETLNLHGATTHSFRHTLGTLLNDVGADVKTIQGILGQKDYKTTMERYVHPIESRKEDAMRKINDLLSPQTGGQIDNSVQKPA